MAPFETLFENDHFIVINKPAGLLSIPDREGKELSLKRMLQDEYGDIFTIHRLDRETSGVIVFAKDEDTHKLLSKAFEERSVEKYYVGIVNGKLPEQEGSIILPIMEHPGKRGVMVVNKKGKASHTDFKVLEEFGKFTLVEFRIHTGRTHQIRVHMADYGHPLICDPVYGDGAPILLSQIKKNYNLSKNELEERPMLARLALHSNRLVFEFNGKKFSFEAEMPKDLRALLNQLRKKFKV